MQDLFSKIDKEDDGAIYLKEIAIYLRAMNEDIDKNLKVGNFESHLYLHLCYVG